MNLVGHVAVALDPERSPPSTGFLVGCMLPDLAAIARVRVARPGGTLGDGVAYHHSCDAAFHDSEWFRATNRSVRDALIDSGIEPGPARACSHAGVEMLLDGRLVADASVEAHARAVLATISRDAEALGRLAPDGSRGPWVERLRMIGDSLDPARYGDVRFVAERLHRMTSGRRRIELRAEHVDVVADTLRGFQPAIGDAAPQVLSDVRTAVPTPRRRG